MYKKKTFKLLLVTILMALTFGLIGFIGYASAAGLDKAKEKLEKQIKTTETYYQKLKQVDQTKWDDVKLADFESSVIIILKKDADVLKTAIDAAKTLKANESATEDELNTGAATLKTAQEAAASATKQGTKKVATSLKGTQIAAIVILVIAIIVPAIMALIKKITTAKENKKALAEINNESTPVNEEPTAENTVEETPQEEVSVEEKITESPQEEVSVEEKPAEEAETPKEPTKKKNTSKKK